MGLSNAEIAFLYTSALPPVGRQTPMEPVHRPCQKQKMVVGHGVHRRRHSRMAFTLPSAHFLVFTLMFLLG